MFKNNLETRKPKIERKKEVVLNIDVATEDDIDAYRKLKQSIKDPEDIKMLGTTEKRVKKFEDKNYDWEKELTPTERRFILLAFDETNVDKLKTRNPDAIGTIGAVKTMNDQWFIDSSYVHPDFRNIKVGEAILATCLDEIISKGGKRALMEVKVDNEIQHRLIDKFFFQKFWENNDRNTFSMYADLTDERVIKKINEVLDAG